MTSNFRAKYLHSAVRRWACLAVGLALGACAAATASDSPAPALDMARLATPAATAGLPGQDVVQASGRVQIIATQARAITSDDPFVPRIVHQDNYDDLTAPILVSAEIVRPLGVLARSASLAIILNGTPMPNSILTNGDTLMLYAIAPDGSALPPTLDVQVGWLGDLRRTISMPMTTNIQASP